MSKPISRREFVRSTAALAGALALAPVEADEPRMPNILLVMSDQQHWRAFGRRDPYFKTPNMDSLTRESAVFENAFCTTPQCSPSRSSVMTGLYPHRTGVIGNIGLAGQGEISELGLRTFGYWLQRAGYKTGFFGKWHLGDVPAAREGWTSFQTEMQPHDPEVSRLGLQFLREQKSENGPFALVLSYIDPHDIYHYSPEGELSDASTPLPSTWEAETFERKPPVQKQFMTEDQGTVIWDKPRKEWQRYHEMYAEKTRLYDEHLGGIITSLRESGMWDRTIVIVASDHGDMDTHHRLIFKGPFMYDHMVRVPLMIRVPPLFGGLSPRTFENDVTLADLFPTILEMAGVSPVACDGESLAASLTGSDHRQRGREFVISQYYGKQLWNNPIRMIRTRLYKYNLYLHWGEELYDLEKDPNELRNVAADPSYAEVRSDLRTKLDDWMLKNHDPFYSYGVTARDGKPVPLDRPA